MTECPLAARLRRSLAWTSLASALAVLSSSTARAITSAPIAGEIQEITVDDPNDVWSSGSLIVGGQRVILPRNLLIDLPANRLTLQELLEQAPAACKALGETGLARIDRCLHGDPGSFVTILANRSDAGNVIAGEVHAQKSNEVLSGIVTFIDHTQGYLRLSGNPGDSATGTLVRINDPSSRFTIQQGIGCEGAQNCSADPRFGVDPDNYTVTFSTGYPACLPSTQSSDVRTRASDAGGKGDAFCPDTNRAPGPVLDSSRFAPIQLGDPLNIEGNFERVGGVRFFSAHTLQVGRALTTSLGQPDYLIFDETGWDAPAFQNQRLRLLFILFTTLGDSQFDIFAEHVDPTTGDEHELPLASTVGNPGTINQGIAPTAAGIAKIRFDVDFVDGAPVRPGLSPCENLGNAGLGTCRAGANLTREFAVVSPLAREVIARSRNKLANPRLRAFDVTGSDAPWGEYLTPVTIVHPEFGEINLDAINTPVVFDGIPWNLDRRLSPGGCSGPCEATPQPLSPFPFSGIDPASEPTLPAGSADRIFSFFPFAAGDRLAWPPPAPGSFPIVPLPDAPLACELPPPANPGPALSDSTAPLPIAVPLGDINVPPLPAAAASLPVDGATISAFEITALPAAARSLPLAGLPVSDLASAALPSADLVLSVALPAALPPIGVPSSLDVLVFNRGSGDAAAGTSLTLIVPEGARSTSNPGWLTVDGQPCDDRAAGTPCTLQLPAVAGGERIALAFGFRLAQVLPLDFRAIQLAARLEPSFSDPTPIDDEVLATLSFAALPDRISLHRLEPPRADNLADFIADQRAAEQLGKLLFWDMQVGSDGKQACASCHFNAGADSRSHNQLNPGQPALSGSSFEFAGPNAELAASDFPLRQLADPSDRDSAALRSRDEVVSSQGVRLGRFAGLDSDGRELSVEEPDPIFQLAGVNLRRVESRNTPTVINAAFNDRNFWDGRAQNLFNGQNPFGNRDPNARVLKRVGDSVEPVAVAIEFSSLASQAVGPPVSAFEMSLEGRSWPHIGKKLLSHDQPLAGQHIHPEDSLLGALSRWPDPGATTSYAALIRAAFRPEWWDAAVRVQLVDGSPRVVSGAAGDLGADEYSQMMYNFSLFFGLAVQAYEATLISDDTPFDHYVGGDSSALSPEQQRGLALFFGSARCSNCHGGPFFSNASITNAQNQPLERMLLGDDQLATYDNGYYNIGVRPTEEDLGVGGSDPFGLPLSNTGLAQLGRFSRDNVGAQPDERIAVSGSFKAPTLRNVALTAPYFHNGGQATLRQVVEFYRRGGDFVNPGNKDPDVIPLVLTDEDLDALVAFLESLTDERVRNASAPFDHPELMLANGALQDGDRALLDAAGAPLERELIIPAVGKSGGTPLPRFLEGDVSSASSLLTTPAL